MLLIMKFRIKPLDILIILLSASLLCITAFNAYVKPKGDLRVHIRGNLQASQASEWNFPIGAHETVVVPGPLGDTVIKIEKSRAWVESSPCGNKTCIATGLLSRHGQWAACLPNKVFIILEGKGTDDIDTVVW
jgi:hypothetical protein